MTEFGSWKSPITLDEVTSDSTKVNSAVLDAVTGQLFWDVHRPSGQYAVFSWNEGCPQEWTPKEYSVVSRVHEYGGAAYFAHSGVLYFVNKCDQVLYKQLSVDAHPQAVTRDIGNSEFRYANGHFNAMFTNILMVREDHRIKNQLCTNTIVAINPESGEQHVIVEGADFYKSVTSRGDKLLFVSWNLPNMPWDVTSLCEGRLIEKDGKLAVENLICLQTNHSYLQPQITGCDQYLYLCDRAGYYNVWKSTADNKPHYEVPLESGFPYGWIFGMPGYAVCKSKSQIVIGAKDQLLLVDYIDPQKKIKDLAGICKEQGYKFNVFANILCHENKIYFIGLADAAHFATLIQMDLDNNSMFAVNKDSSAPEKLIPYISHPDLIEFPTTDGATAFGFLYKPKNPDFDAPKGSKPPLLIRVHGGPTGMAVPSLDLKVQYFTSRGFAFFDIDYRGSTGFGRKFRQELYGKWGILDLDDCVYAAQHLTKAGVVDKTKLAIDGGSAGGFTAMAVMVYRDTFHAGVSYFGVSDLENLAKITHKFEARYLDQMIGKLPENRDKYTERSPITHPERIKGAIGFLQGSEDFVVPPSQSKEMFEVVKANKIPTYYIEFEGEGHGFKKAGSVQRSLSSEILFYSKVFKFKLADEVENPPEYFNL